MRYTRFSRENLQNKFCKVIDQMDRKLGSILKRTIALDDALLDDAEYLARLHNVKIGSVLIEKSGSF